MAANAHKDFKPTMLRNLCSCSTQSLRRMHKEAKTGQDAPFGANRFIITAREANSQGHSAHGLAATGQFRARGLIAQRRDGESQLLNFLLVEVQSGERTLLHQRDVITRDAAGETDCERPPARTRDARKRRAAMRALNGNQVDRGRLAPHGCVVVAHGQTPPPTTNESRATFPALPCRRRLTRPCRHPHSLSAIDGKGNNSSAIPWTLVRPNCDEVNE